MSSDKRRAHRAKVRSRMCALFVFEDGGDGFVCERVYFNPDDILRQLELA